MPGDVAEPGLGKRIIEAGLHEFGRIDTLVNNAGVFLAKPFTEYTAADYDLVLGVNLRGFFELSQSAAEAMLAQGGGHIVNITTTLADHALSTVPSALASLTKGGLNSVTKSLATEYASRGIRVNAVAPGFTVTEMTADLADTETGRQRLRDMPLGRFGRADEVAEAVLFLLTDASSLFLGQTLNPNAGGYMP